jgi:predicted SAM-dependent methyltransferase
VIRRLQLGTSRFENLPPAIVATFAQPSWVSLGEAPPKESSVDNLPRKRSRFVQALSSLKRRKRRVDPTLYRRTNFIAYYFQEGIYLPFRDQSLTFVFSEHFFEHLFMDEAFELFRECYRVLQRGGVMRTVVPDADLRVYEPPESVGVGRDGHAKGLELPWTNPNKHKSRWSIHNLPLLLDHAGFAAIPLTYCDREGQLHQRNPQTLGDCYANCVDAEMVFRMDYLLRPLSLVVDAIKQ